MAKSLTQGSPAKLILGFALPLFIGNLFQQIYNIADTLIVGRTIGVNALAAVGGTGAVVFLIIGFVQAMATGFSIITAQRFGAADADGVRKSFCVSIVCSACVAVVLTAFSVWLARDMLVHTNTPAAILEDSYTYISVIYLGISASVLFNLLSATILALGDSKTPLFFLVIACILNVILDFVFILVFSWGVSGAAWATVTAQMVASLLCVIYIVRKQPVLHLSARDWSMTRDDILRTLRIGLPMGFQASIIAVGALILQAALNSLGSVAVAAYATAQKIDMVAVLPMMSFGLAMATYVGQNYGAGDIERIRTGIRQCCAMSVSFSIVVALINIFAGRHFIELFVGQGYPEVTALAQTYLNINGSMYWTLALLFVFRYSLQGLGQSFAPTIAGIMELLMRAVAGILLTQTMGFTGACFANPLAWIGACVPLISVYFVTMRKLTHGSPSAPAYARATC